jgi:hypothetical protein
MQKILPSAVRRNFSLGDQVLQILDELDVIVRRARPVWNHDHIEAGVDGGLDVRFVIGRNLVNGRPVWLL